MKPIKYFLGGRTTSSPWRQRLLAFVLGLLFALGMTPAFAQLPRFTQVSASVITPSQSTLPAVDLLNIAEASPVELIEQGKLLYQESQWDEAIAQWKAALSHPDLTTPSLEAATLWQLLALAYQKQGQWETAAQAISNCSQLLEALPTETSGRDTLRAQLLNTQGLLAFAQGQSRVALKHWQNATQLYRDLSDQSGITGSLLNQAKALETAGYYRRACDQILEAATIEGQSCDFWNEGSLEQVIQAFQNQSDPKIQRLGFQNLGNIARLLGHLPEAETLLNQSLKLTPLPKRHSILLNLAQVEATRFQQAALVADQSRGKRDRQKAVARARKALKLYREAQVLATSNGDGQHYHQATVRQLHLLTQLYAWTPAQEQANLQTELLDQVNLLQTVPFVDSASTHSALLQQIDLVESLMGLLLQPALTRSIAPDELQQRLETVKTQAHLRQDAEAQSYALGALGHLNEVRAEMRVEDAKPASHKRLELWQQAQRQTEDAIQLAQASQLEHINYRWQWQLGRLLKAQWETSEQPNESLRQQAILAYQAAEANLKAVRQDLIAVDSEVRFGLRDSFEPMYRELVSLLVKETDGKQPQQDYLKQAIQEIDALQLTELENFLSCNLSPVLDLGQAQDDPSAAIIYPMILPEQLVVLVRLPQTEELLIHHVDLEAQMVNDSLRDFRRQVVKLYYSQAFFERSQQTYDWLIRPFQQKLEAHQVKTLVFVSDGALRNIPMAALHDGERFLLEDYAIALSPGIQLPKSTPLDRDDLRALAFGLSEMRPDLPDHKDFAPLPYVLTEVRQIQRQLQSEALLNQAFTSESLRQLVSEISSPVIHLATHGQFSSDPRQTFLLAWDRRINLQDFSAILQARAAQLSNPIELLVMSACKTAEGDNRATLGLAGVAIQSGAKSTIASLWYIDDQATAEMMSHLYDNLASSEQTQTRAEALRQSQLTLLHSQDFQAPVYWAPYVLVGNWL